MSTDANRERAFDLYHVRGMTCAAAAKELGTSAPSIIRWARAYQKHNPEAAAAKLAAGKQQVAQQEQAIAATNVKGFMAQVAERVGTKPAEDDETEGPVDAIVLHQQAISRLNKAIEDANANNNIDAVGHLMRTLQGLVTGLRQLEKAKKQDEGVFHISMTEVEQAKARMERELPYIDQFGDRCVDCGKLFRMRKVTEE